MLGTLNRLCTQDLYDPKKDHIVTAASCTTNCLAPVVKVCVCVRVCVCVCACVCVCDPKKTCRDGCFLHNKLPGTSGQGGWVGACVCVCV